MRITNTATQQLRAILDQKNNDSLAIRLHCDYSIKGYDELVIGFCHKNHSDPALLEIMSKPVSVFIDKISISVFKTILLDYDPKKSIFVVKQSLQNKDEYHASPNEGEDTIESLVARYRNGDVKR